MIKHTFLAAVLTAAIAPAFAAEWVGDFDAAKTKAAQENKAILADFTGSDWCGWCIRLRQNVFDTPAFESYAKDKFVLAEIDLPQAPKISPEQLEKNRRLCAQYGVQSFPTIMVMDANGRVMGGFTGGRTSLQAVQPHLDKALENLALFKQAASQQGDAKLQTLVKIYKNFPDSLKQQAADLRDEILALDTQDSAGLKDTLLAEQQFSRFEQECAAAKTEEELIAMLERMKSEALPPNKAEILMRLFTLKLKNANTTADVLAAKELILQAADAMPDKKDAIRAAVEQQFADPAALLQQIKAYRSK